MTAKTKTIFDYDNYKKYLCGTWNFTITALLIMEFSVLHIYTVKSNLNCGNFYFIDDKEARRQKYFA